jgi:hypothetical protein
MQLKFRGKSYNQSSPSVEIETTTEETINFLGRSAQVKRITVAQRQQPTQELKFLGRSYTR